MASPETVNIPQKPPMVMIDCIVRAVEGVTETTFLIREDNVFCDCGLFSEAGLVENIAQTAAAGAGCKPGITGKEPPVGYIGGIRNLKIVRYPSAGEELFTRTTIEHEVFDASVVTGESYVNDCLIATCQLKIFYPRKHE